MAKPKDVWKDPVGSKLIAEGLKELIKWGWGALIIPLYAFIKAIVTKASFVESLKQTWKSIVNFFIDGFQINLITILLMVAGYILLNILFRKVAKFSKKNAVTSFNSANIWGANIEWKWVKENGEYTIKYGDYKMICPKCFHNLSKEIEDGQYFLKCQNIACDFTSGVYHYEPPSGVRVVADMSTFYFHRALTSTVDAELRKKSIQK
ncbi:hypothetical protein A3860_39745 [Niastella vici]|uniref:Uncharacterized protein n=2 Tax=Niastella vici TaxID=1703345 RepID=A0A1V9FHV4_9BACT|nr:hypothetical protein A3860_39745 [Niastella vici]